MGFLSRKSKQRETVALDEAQPFVEELESMEEAVPEQRDDENGSGTGELRPAGPVADEGSSSSQAAGEDPPSESPAADADDSDDEAPAADEGADEGAGEGQAAEAEKPEAEAAPDQEKTAEEPKQEKKAEEPKKDAIPGADLEPILVEEEERPLSAEERARREAEEEERARREAQIEGEEEQDSTASRAPAKLESGARFLATGKRKNAIARVTVLPGSGEIEVNRRPLAEFFPRPLHQTMARQPLTTTGYEGSVDVRVRVHGGGISGQAGAVRHGIARALTEVDPDLRGELKRRGFLTRDARVKERRKAGLKKARKRPQFSKR
jgi:small subunit ribosomal protein S9